MKVCRIIPRFIQVEYPLQPDFGEALRQLVFYSEFFCVRFILRIFEKCEGIIAFFEVEIKSSRIA